MTVQSITEEWRVKVFGDNLGIDDYDTEALLPQEAQAIIRQQPFHQLVN
ncbi:hypothetical protein [Hymenobacter lucidus]|uniref:Uncharacterized protein n=1 Tax=Hymenobacter lucidus TaxID=2880930 RepID=A0ABS8AQ67_9BACT|nr:hypothetical protein [Hymenobacter lucidus]MCB2408254.1 hypothetical protein [Hymenobacter lucidus]